MKFSRKLLISSMFVSSMISILEIASGQRQSCSRVSYFLLPYYGWWLMPILIQFGCNSDPCSINPERPPPVMNEEPEFAIGKSIYAGGQQNLPPPAPGYQQGMNAGGQPNLPPPAPDYQQGMNAEGQQNQPPPAPDYQQGMNAGDQQNLPPPAPDYQQNSSPSTPNPQSQTGTYIGDVQEYEKSFPNCGQKPYRAKQQEVREGKNSTKVQHAGGDETQQYRSQDQLANPQQFRQQFIRSKRSEEFIYRVVHGEIAVKQAWPWMAGLFQKNGDEKTFACGSSIISDWFVLSAAHCFNADMESGINPDKYIVITGDNVRWRGDVHAVQTIIIHPSYEQPKLYNDLSLLKLVEPVKMSETVLPICIPPYGLEIELVPNVDHLTVTGWGIMEEDGDPSNILRELTVPVFSQEVCDANYKNMTEVYPLGITSSLICAGFPEGGKDTCQGDSGGPMVVELPDKKWMQLGIVSSGFECGRPGFPGLYTRVSEFRDWIFQNTNLRQY